MERHTNIQLTGVAGKISRRQVLRGIAAIGWGAIGASVLAACQQQAAPSPTAAPATAAPAKPTGAPAPAAPTAAPKPTSAPAAAARPTAPAKVAPTGQIVFAARMSELETLHPFNTRLSRAQAVSYHVNEGLTKFDPDFKIVPGLAERWQVSGDNLTYTFDLRRSVQWHDGQPFTARDVKFTFDAATAADSKSAAKGVLTTYVGALDTPDDSRVVITLKKPYSPLLSTLADQLQILPAHLLKDDISAETFSKAPVGTGPYKVKEHQVDFLSLEANADYWGQLPFTQRIILKDAPEPAAQQAGLLAGELDVVAFVPTVMAAVKAQGFPVYKGAAASVHGINLDLQAPQLQDARVRKALWMGLDRERIRALHYTDGILANAAVSTAYGQYHNDTLAPISQDARAASALLEQAGWRLNSSTGIREKGGEPLKMKHYAWTAKQWQDIATVAQASWKQLGVDVEVVVVENAKIADTVSGRYDAAPIGWGLTSDPIVGLDLLFRTTTKTFKEGGTRNVFRYSNSEVDKLLEEGLATANFARRVEIANAVQKRVYDDAPFIPIAYPVYELATRKNILLDEDQTGKGTLSGVGVGYFMNRWRTKS